MRRLENFFVRRPVETGAAPDSQEAAGTGFLGYMSITTADKLRNESSDHIKPFDRRTIKGMTVSSSLSDSQIGGSEHKPKLSNASPEAGIRLGGESTREESKLLSSQDTGDESIDDDIDEEAGLTKSNKK